MNTQFSLARFAKLFIYEHRSSNFLRYATLLIILYCIVVNIITTLTVSAAIDGESLFFPVIKTFIMGYLSAAFYYPLLKKENRELYEMQPASNLEKYLSVLANTVVVVPAFFILLNLVPLIGLYIKYGEEIPGLEFYKPGLNELCYYIQIISIVTYLFFSSMSRSKMVEGNIIVAIYWLSGPLRREFDETGHLLTSLLVIAIFQILIYLRIRRIGQQ